MSSCSGAQLTLVSRQAIGSLQQGAILSQNVFCELVLVFD